MSSREAAAGMRAMIASNFAELDDEHVDDDALGGRPDRSNGEDVRNRLNADDWRRRRMIPKEDQHTTTVADAARFEKWRRLNNPDPEEIAEDQGIAEARYNLEDHLDPPELDNPW